MEKKLEESIKKIIEKKIDLIELGSFYSLFEQIIREYDYQVCKEFFEILDKAKIKVDVESIKSSYYLMNRIKQIKCYNIGFGDCFLCKDGTDNCSKMLVDFGARKTDNAVINNLANELSATDKKYLMLSHLHIDHYRGFSHVNVTDIQHFNFDEIYIPNYITNNGLEFLGEVLLSSNSISLLEQVKTLLKIPLLFPKYVKKDAKIFLLREGNRIYNSLCAFEVLLPQRQSVSYILNPQTEQIVRNFADAYRNLLGYIEEGEEFATIRVYSEMIEKEFDGLIERLLERKLDINITMNERKLKKRFDGFHNSLSLAFHESLVDDCRNVLFLGDAESTDVKYLADSNKLKNEYCFVKVQHHGTRDYFYNGLPVSKYYGISNGGSREGWESSALYDVHYGDKSTLICTNNCNCELTRKGVHCKSKTKVSAKCGTNALFRIVDIL